MNRLVLNKWYGGISNDPNLGTAGSVFNIESLDIHSNSKNIKLSKSHNNDSLINTRGSGMIIASLYENNIYYIELSKDGYLSGILNNESNSGYIIKGELGSGCNIGKITNSNGFNYGFLLTSNYFTKWDYNPNQYDLGYYASLSTGINTDPNFQTPGSWTIGTGWSITGGDSIHTPGNTAVLSMSMTCNIGKKYRIAVQYTCSGGTCDVKVASNTKITLNTTNSNKTQTVIYTASSISELLEFSPSSDFNGTIYSCYIQEIYATSTSKTFNEKSPYVIYSDYIYVGNGNIVTKIDMTTGTPIITDGLTIDKDFTIIGITRISDQFYIYASNGSNSRQYMWDAVETSPVRIITWVDKPIQNVANFANIDYVIVGTGIRQQIAAVNGYQLQPLVVTNDYINTSDRIYFNANYTNSIETIGNKILIGGDGGIYSFGSKTPGLGQALVKEFLYNGGSLTNIFYSENIGYSIFAYFTGTIDNGNGQGVFGNYRIQISLTEGDNNEQYGSVYFTNVGWIETQPIFGETYSNIKSLVKYTIGCKLEDKTFINVYIKEIDGKYVTFYTKNYNCGLAIGDIYTFSGRTFTVLNIINDVTYNGYLVYCSYTGNKLTGKPNGTLTKTSGSGPATLYTDLMRYGYKMLNSFTDISQTRLSANITGDFNETQFAIELGSFYQRNTPKLYDFNLYFNEVTND